jgi:hypothetical protein
MKRDSSENAVILVAQGKKYPSFLRKTVADYSRKERMCVVSLNRGYANLERQLHQKKINTKEILFVDALTQKEERRELDNVVYVDSPRAYTQLSIATKKALSKGFTCVVFDSLSSLARFKDLTITYKFAEDLIHYVRSHNKKIIFTLLKADADDVLATKLQTLVDRVSGSEKTQLTKNAAVNLMGEVFGPNASKLVKNLPSGKPEVLLKKLEKILTQLVGPENAQQQVKELMQRYARSQ